MRGVYEKPEGSGIWWIHYYAAGKRHREKVGRKSDAIKLYQSRKADATAGRKLPELRDSKVLRFSELIDDALEFVIDHKDRRSYVSKAEIVRKAFGSTPAAEITPQELERWLRSHCKTPATANRYKAFISLCYREGVHNNKTTINPARQVRHRREGVGRLRFLTREEYDRLYKVIERRFPEHLAEFIISVSTGMRLLKQPLGEQTATKTATNENDLSERRDHFRYKSFRILVPGGGVEPPRGCPRRILSPLRLPVPPSRLALNSISVDGALPPHCR